MMAPGQSKARTRTAADGLRGALVEVLRSKGCLRSPGLAEAFAAVPRHLFIPHVSVEEAYRDQYIVTKRLPDGEAAKEGYLPATILKPAAPWIFHPRDTTPHV
jgi:protein-L-isoaspartate(D-aspartate) O-methyltransferase